MVQLDIDEMIKKIDKINDLTPTETVDLYCDLGMVIGALGSRDSLLMTLLGTSQYEKELKLLMAAQVYLFPHALAAIVTVAKNTATWKTNSGGFSPN